MTVEDPTYRRNLNIQVNKMLKLARKGNRSFSRDCLSDPGKLQQHWADRLDIIYYSPRDQDEIKAIPGRCRKGRGTCRALNPPCASEESGCARPCIGCKTCRMPIFRCFAEVMLHMWLTCYRRRYKTIVNMCLREKRNIQRKRNWSIVQRACAQRRRSVRRMFGQ